MGFPAKCWLQLPSCTSRCVLEDSCHQGEMVKGQQSKTCFPNTSTFKRLRRKRLFHFRVCVLSLLMGILRIGSFLGGVAAPPRSQSASLKSYQSYQSTKHFHSTPFSPKWFRKIIFVPPLKWYCNFLLETISQKAIKGSKGRKGLWFFFPFPQPVLEDQNEDSTSVFLQCVKCQYTLTL